ncbi:MAG: glycosyltransferase family 4 protein [Actinomycetota bacterium]|nr:glycosyltransferase family 4 protein [Actinomycetota bacterium]
MRILQVALYGSVKGGTESYVGALCHGLRDLGHEVVLAYRYDPDPARPEVRAGRELAAISSQEQTADAAREVEALIADARPELVHVHNVDAPWMPRFFAERVPTLYGVHDHRIDCPVGTRYWAAWHKGCTVVPGLKCLSYNVAAHCGSLRANVTLRPYANWKQKRAEALRVPRIQVFSKYMAGMLTTSGIARERIDVTAYPVPPMPDAATIPHGDTPVVFATGRLVKEKGFETLIAAMDHVPMPVELVIAGEGHFGEDLRRKSKTVASRHRVRFLGWLGPAELAGWYLRADVVAVPSAWPEPFGIVGLEAMAAGRAVVAPRIGGIEEWLSDGVTGIVVPPHDAEAFGAALAQLTADAGMRTRMGEAGRARAHDEFSLARHMERVEALYKQVMHQ